MPALLTRTVRTTQPQEPAILDRSNPITSKFDILAVFNPQNFQRNLVRPGLFWNDTSSQRLFVPGRYGVGLYANGFGGCISFGQIGEYPGGSMFLAFSLTFIPGSIGNGGMLVSKGAISGNGYVIQMYGDGHFVFNASSGGVLGELATPAGTFADGNSYTVVVTGTSGTPDWIAYVNGRNVTVPPVGNLSIGTAGATSLGLMQYVAASGLNWNGIFHWYGSGPYLLSPAQATSLSLNPWQIFAPVPQHLYLEPAPSGGGPIVAGGALTRGGSLIGGRLVTA